MILTVNLNAAIDKRYVVDDFKVGEVNRVRECTYVPGGKGLNVSKPASIYGAEVVATGFVGGHAGNYIEAALKPFGIKSAFYHVDAESRSCINIWDEVNHVQTEFLEPGFTLTEADFEGFEKKFRQLVKDASVVAMSGSVPKGLDGSAYQRLVKIVKDAGKPVILDTSGKLLEEGIKAAPTLIKPNIDEIRMLTGKSCDNFQDMVDAAKQIHADGVEIVAVSLGGDGSFAGAQKLANLGINTIGVPGTIDLDIACTDYTIGFDTAINTAMEAIDKVRDTSTSHERCSIIEVMGRSAGYIALWCGVANGAENILLPEYYDGDEQALINQIIENRKKGKKHHLIINAEGVGHSASMAKRIEAATGIETRATILGHMQRGGSPTCLDRYYASMMGARAVELLCDGASNRVVALRDGKFVDYDINEALAMKKTISPYEYEVSKMLSR